MHTGKNEEWSRKIGSEQKYVLHITVTIPTVTWNIGVHVSTSGGKWFLNIKYD